jgi:hypothetical protein
MFETAQMADNTSVLLSCCFLVQLTIQAGHVERDAKVP